MKDSRPQTEIDVLANSYVKDIATLDPSLASYLGIPGQEEKMPDLSVAGIQKKFELTRDFAHTLANLSPVDEADRITQDIVQERFEVARDLHEAKEYRRNLNSIASPVQELRQIFDLMPTDTTADWENIASRLASLPESMKGYQKCLAEGQRYRELPALRQIELAIEQSNINANEKSSFFTSLVNNARPDGQLPSSNLKSRLDSAASSARQAYADLANFLTELAEDAPTHDGVGRERYARFSQEFLGAKIDFDETYEWGLEQLQAITIQQQKIAAELYGDGVGVKEAMRRLDNDPARKVHGIVALKQWLQETADEAINNLKDTHFDIPEPVQTIECVIDTIHNEGIYYLQPTQDFSRPGRICWSTPKGITEFSTWFEKTTVYHEGAPGHHLQLGQTTYRAKDLNKFWSLMCNALGYSGYIEGWALYAETLMDELGFLADPADRMGMFDSQRLRAVRVVLDIGIHLGKSFPKGYGHDGEIWNAKNAWAFLRNNVSGADSFLQFELNRYLGWPGQASSYLIGKRLWLQLRTQAQQKAAKNNEKFSLKEFHGKALNLGTMGLDILSKVLAEA